MNEEKNTGRLVFEPVPYCLPIKRTTYHYTTTRNYPYLPYILSQKNRSTFSLHFPQQASHVCLNVHCQSDICKVLATNLLNWHSYRSGSAIKLFSIKLSILMDTSNSQARMQGQAMSYILFALVHSSFFFFFFILAVLGPVTNPISTKVRFEISIKLALQSNPGCVRLM